MDNLMEQAAQIGEFEMPFGKYKNMSVNDIYKESKNYLEWMYDRDPDSFIGFCLGIYLQVKNGGDNEI